MTVRILIHRSITPSALGRGKSQPEVPGAAQPENITIIAVQLVSSLCKINEASFDQMPTLEESTAKSCSLDKQAPLRERDTFECMKLVNMPDVWLNEKLTCVSCSPQCDSL